MGDAVALVLAEQEVAREVGALGIIREQIAQQQGGALDVASALLEQLEDLVVLAGPVQQGHRITLVGTSSASPPPSPVFHRRFTGG